MRVLSDLQVGESGILVALELPLGVQNHLMHMGFVTEAIVKAVHRAPAGDPTVYSVDGIEIALRRDTARAIQIRAKALVVTESSAIMDRGSILAAADAILNQNALDPDHFDHRDQTHSTQAHELVGRATSGARR